jgi:phosphatidylethanolamine/phosphatidyl-N-methylethanolamine N-methyltransferase
MASLGLFLQELVRDPRTVSAVVPSSAALARAMVAGLGPDSGPVAEFGPGTGVFTRALIDAGLPSDQLILFEVNPAFCVHLRRVFPGVRVVNQGAQTIADPCPDGVAAIISGLPLLSFPPGLCEDIYSAAAQALRPSGYIRQFTYGNRAPLPEPIRAALGFHVTAGPRIWRNLPPARVYTYRPG